MNVYCVPQDAINPIWDKVEPFFKRALKNHDAEFSLEDLKDAVSTGRWSLFAFINDDNILNGGAVVSFMSYPKSYVAFVTCVGGKSLINPQYYEKFMALLKSYGADRVQGYVTDAIVRLYGKIGVAKRTNLVEVKL